MFSTSAVGVVIRPDSTGGLIRCAYPRDGNSMNTEPHGCGWGSMQPDQFAEMMRASQSNAYQSACAPSWLPPSAEDRSGCRYNEIVLDGYVWKQRLPFLVEAIFYPVGGHVDAWEGDANRAREIQRNFVEAYGLALPDAPLLAYDIEEARAGRAPFRLG
mgnify:CR=1 FL=1